MALRVGQSERSGLADPKTLWEKDYSAEIDNGKSGSQLKIVMEY